VKILLDTCTFLWIATGDSSLSKRAAELFVHPENEVYLSVASTWEIAVKYKLGNCRFQNPRNGIYPPNENSMK